MSVLDYTGLQYLYAQMVSKFADNSIVSSLSENIINCQTKITPISNWLTNSFDEINIKGTTYPEFKGAAKYPNISSASDSQTYSLVGYTNLKLYDSSDLFFSSSNNQTTLNIGSQLKQGCLSLSSLNGNFAKLTPSSGNSYLTLPSGGSEENPLKLAL